MWGKEPGLPESVLAMQEQWTADKVLGRNCPDIEGTKQGAPDRCPGRDKEPHARAYEVLPSSNDNPGLRIVHFTTY